KKLSILLVIAVGAHLEVMVVIDPGCDVRCPAGYHAPCCFIAGPSRRVEGLLKCQLFLGDALSRDCSDRLAMRQPRHSKREDCNEENRLFAHRRLPRSL